MDEHDRNTVARPIVIDVDLSGRSHDLAAHHGLLIGIHESSAWRGFGSVAGPLRAITAPWRERERLRSSRRSAGVAGLIPGLDDGRVALPAEPRDRRCPQREMAADLSRQPEPPSGEHAQDVSVGEDEDVAVDGAEALDQTVGAPGDVLDGLAVRPRAVPDRPARVVLPDLRRATAFH